LFSAKFSDDVDYTIACGGSKGELFIWQLEENPIFCNRYGIKFEEIKVKVDDCLNINNNNNKLLLDSG
jgi:hypothetical protein